MKDELIKKIEELKVYAIEVSKTNPAERVSLDELWVKQWCDKALELLQGTQGEIDVERPIKEDKKSLAVLCPDCNADGIVQYSGGQCFCRKCFNEFKIAD